MKRIRQHADQLTFPVDSRSMRIEEQVRIEGKLAELAAIVECCDDAIVSSTTEGVITSWNRAAQRLYGYAAEEVVGRTLSILSPETRAHDMPNFLERINQGERVVHCETVHMTREGRLFDISLTVSPIQSSRGTTVGVSAIVRDITAHKQAQEALRESERRYRLLFDSSPLPMWIFDSQTFGFLQVNKAAVQRYGFSSDELLTMTVFDIMPKEDAMALLHSASLQSSELHHLGAWRHRAKDGRLLDVEVTRHRVNFRGIEAHQVSAYDITERRRNDAKLLQSEERFSKAFRCSPLAMSISTKEESRYVDVNEAFLKMLGHEWEQVVGKTVHDLNIWITPEHRTGMIEQLNRSERVTGFETQFRTRYGQARTVQLSAEIINLDGTSCILAIMFDVTDTKRLERQYLQAQKMDAIGRLAGGVAHDFNNILGVIIGYSDMTQDLLAPESPAGKQVGHIRRAADRAATLTRQLLAFSRQQVLRPCVIDLNAVIKDLSSMLLRLIREDISLEFIPSEEIGNVRADVGQLEQILMNLAVNARDAIRGGGIITIETANVVLDDIYAASHDAVAAGAYVMLSVSDSGCGIATEIMPHIFEPFFTTKPPGAGTGLGLSMVHGVVQQSGGHIWVYSEVGKGTTFKIYFPRVSEPVEPASIHKEERRLPKLSDTILIVEDDDAIRDLTVGLLRGEGYTVIEAKDGSTALETAQKFQETIHLLLTDVVLPGMSGVDLVSRLVQARPGMKVTYMSGYTRNLIAHHGLLEQNAEYLQKPFSKLSLLDHVRAALDLSANGQC
jgi:two-component system, cell cycle sensor histidine kinase and response regulator CckA